MCPPSTESDVDSDDGDSDDEELQEQQMQLDPLGEQVDDQEVENREVEDEEVEEKQVSAASDTKIDPDDEGKVEGADSECCVMCSLTDKEPELWVECSQRSSWVHDSCLPPHHPSFLWQR